MDSRNKTLDEAVARNDGVREHRITDMHIIAWALTVIAFATLWVAFQVTLIAADL